MLHSPAVNIFGTTCPNCWYNQIYQWNNWIDDAKRAIRDIEKQESVMTEQWMHDRPIEMESDTNAYRSLQYVVKQTNFNDFRFLHQRGLCDLVPQTAEINCLLCRTDECQECNQSFSLRLLTSSSSIGQLCKTCVKLLIRKLKDQRDAAIQRADQARARVQNTKFS